MWDKHLHIVSLNVPLPANYGGIIDIWYKIKALAQCGVKVHLHCFTYGRQPAKELEDVCYSVNYYNRHIGINNWFSTEPYIVKSRDNAELLQNLIDFDAPILFEGLHTSHFLNASQLRSRLKIVRTHNIEHQYYNYLKKQECNPMRKFYFATESAKLQRYEDNLAFADIILAISPSDTQYFSEKYGKTFLIHPFHPNNDVSCPTGLGKHILYHADLSVPENIKAALFLTEALKGIDFQVIFAGRNPSKTIIKHTKDTNIQVIGNPSQTEMDNLVRAAQIIALPTFQPTGIKLKLIESLYKGRHCVATPAMVENTGLEPLCHIAPNTKDFNDICRNLIKTPMTASDIEKRKSALKNYDTKSNAEKIIWLITSNL